MKQIFLLFVFAYIQVWAATEPVVLVTGASRGIGHAIASQLADEGYLVYAGVRKDAPFNPHHENLRLVELDVTNQESIDAAITTIILETGRIDVLVNNAGIMVYGSVENVTIEEAKRLFDVNFFGMMRVTQSVLPIMRQQKKGRIIQISSRSAFRPVPSISVHAASKYALEGLSETMATLLKPWNIDVCLIEPGPVNTDLVFTSPYGSRLSQEEDPYFSIFEQAGLLNLYNSTSQQPKEIAAIVQQAIEAEHPLFRYQTTPAIEEQAAKRLVDITGLSSIQEWNDIIWRTGK